VRRAFLLEHAYGFQVGRASTTLQVQLHAKLLTR
jgi:hypothetical protein